MSTITRAQSACPSYLPGPAEIYRFTIEQYDQMILDGTIAEDDPVELLSGILVRKMPKKPKHSVITAWLVEEFRRQLPAGWHVRQEQPLRIPDYDEPEPDLALVRGAIMDFALRHPGAADVALVGEVSGTTLDRDRGEKRAAYARGGIPVYWIINLIDNQIEVYTDPSPAYGYQTRVIYRPGEQLSIVVDAQARGMIVIPDLFLGRDEETDEIRNG
ncbi:MAG: Uma2 family endonuclease [Isosphaeraceae bacterium]